MVYCSDSERSAELAKDAHLPVGLHLNLTEVFTSASVPSCVRKRQAIVVRRLGANKYARWVVWPELVSIIKPCVTDQLKEFTRLYGTPTHIDGHHHIQISANVMAANALPRDIPLRRSFTFEQHERSTANRAFRKAVNLLVSWRWQSSARFLDINDFVVAQSAAVRKVQHADNEVVEVMCHPEVASDWAFLTSEAWASILLRYELGSYDALNLRKRS